MTSDLWSARFARFYLIRSQVSWGVRQNTHLLVAAWWGSRTGSSYEREVNAEFSSKFRNATVVHDTTLPGFRSGIKRQIDTLISIGHDEAKTQIVVEAKRHARPIDVKHVEAFIGVLGDVQVSRGIMVSASRLLGVSRCRRPYRDDVDLDLDIFSLAELKAWQGFAIPYAGDQGLVVPSPGGVGRGCVAGSRQSCSTISPGAGYTEGLGDSRNHVPQFLVPEFAGSRS